LADTAESLCGLWMIYQVMDILWGLQMLGMSIKHKAAAAAKPDPKAWK